MNIEKIISKGIAWIVALIVVLYGLYLTESPWCILGITIPTVYE